jgi:uncharacterized membrane protein YbaN (DUF454 family)
LKTTSAPAELRPLRPFVRWLLIGIGTISLGLGILGVFVPGLPTTVFLLIAGGCYMRSSDHLYRWMLTRPWLKKSLDKARAFEERRALPLSVKLTAMAFAWGSVALTLVLRASGWPLAFVVVMALGCTAAMIIIKTDRG